MIGINYDALNATGRLDSRFCTEMTWIATAEVAAVEDMMIMAVCSLTTDDASDTLVTAVNRIARTYC